MTRLRFDDIPEQLAQDSEVLLEGLTSDIHRSQDYNYFSARAAQTALGRPAILLTLGSHGGEEGYESYASQVVLRYNEEGRLKSVSGKERFEPVGPVLIPKPDLVDKFKDWLHERGAGVAARFQRKQELKDRAARYISAALQLLEK